MKFTRLIGKISLTVLSAFVVIAACFAAGAFHLQTTAAAGSLAVPAACPAATINGTIGSGSPDHPFVTGNQTSRLFRDAVESTCGAQKATPNLTDTGIQFKFDAFTFSNTSVLAICVTVITTAGANNQILTAAYDQSFNPANVQANYLGDAGNSDKTRAFSFIVPGNHSFVVVQSRVNNAANPPSLGYSFKVLGLPTCNSCPPAIMTGTIGSGSNQYPASIDTQTGRLFRNSAASVCSPAKPVPSVEDDTTQFQYDAYTFLNPSLSAVCVTVNTTAAANNQILTAAYLDRFNPFDVQENYLGDAGNSNQSRSFSFTVPGRRSFVVVQSRVNNAGNPPSLGYFFSVSGLTGCTSCQVIGITPDDVPNGLTNTPYSQQLTRTGGAASGTWSVSFGALPTGLTLNPTTGLLSGTPTTSGNFSFSARFTDSNNCLGEKVYFFSIITCQTITLGPEPLPRAAVNTLYSQQLTATGGTPAYTFSVIGGTPPTGITLSSSGLLSGTATTTTPANFTVRATDANGCTGTKTYTLIVCGPITVNPATALNGFVGTAYSQSFTQSGAGASPAWSSTGTLPPGLTLNPSTGLLSGTPTTVGAFSFTIRATAFNGCFGERSYTVIISGDGLQFFPLPRPVRLLDTRAGQGNCDSVGAPIAAGTSILVQGRGTCESITIPATAQAIAGNISAINTTSQTGFLTLYPNGVAQPTSANMIYAPNQILTNGFTVALSGAGEFRIFAERQIEAIVDISGYFAPPSAGGLFFHPLPKPVRLLDTRAGQGNCDSVNSPISAGANLVVQGRGTCEGLTIPTAAQAIAGNVTVINPNAQSGFMTLYPNGVAQPVAANMVYSPGQLLANAFTVSLSGGGQFNIFAERTIDVILDVSGYYSTEAVDANGAGLLFSPLPAPARLLDTRPGFGNCDNISNPIPAGTSLIVLGRISCEGQPIPPDAQALAGNLTVINSNAQTGFLTLFPHGGAAPLAANIIYGPGQVLSNAFIVGLDASGEFDIFAERTIHVVLDISGYFAP
jgi:hypothetical protein